jgi:glycosyltransferase involved in cell wall biosynthesis
MMKILYWTPLFLPDIGGIETLSAKLLPELQKRNYDIVVLTSHGKHGVADKTEFEGIPVFRFHFRDVFGKHDLHQLFRLRAQVAKLKQSFKPDLIHIHMSDPSVYFHLSTLSAFPAPTIVTIHQDTKCLGFKGGLDTLLGNTLRMTAWVTAVSKATLFDLIHIEPEIENRSSVIYNGLDSPDIIPAPLPFDPPRILCLGRLIHTKGLDLAVTAFSSLLNRFPRVRLTIVGEGPQRTQLEKQVINLGLTESVEFMGRVEPEEVPAVINQATVIVMPSRVEGFPMRALEAAQMARPVVATPAGGLAEAIVHQQTGLIIEKENSFALAEAVGFLLGHPDVAVRMGQAARSRVLGTFSLKSCVDSYDRLYRRLIGTTSVGADV